jgi:hypothetical protein|tara:strand:- start:848 stop:1291 length:444 start_codon:yes stop_codon:yes gene_type:complete
MKFLKDLLKIKKRQELYLVVILVIYILFNFKTPDCLTNIIDNAMGKIIIIIFTIAIAMKTNPILGVLSIIAAYELIKRSSRVNQIFTNDNIPSEKTKMIKLQEMNDFSITLEEEIVKNIPPLVKYDLPSCNTFKPVLNNTHNADSTL